MIYCCMELHLSGVFVDFLYFMKTLYTDQFPKKLEKLAAMFFGPETVSLKHCLKVW